MPVTAGTLLAQEATRPKRKNCMPAQTNTPYLTNDLSCSPKGSSGYEGGPSIRPYLAWTTATAIPGTAMAKPKKEIKNSSTRTIGRETWRERECQYVYNAGG